jgi:hypothetical protein
MELVIWETKDISPTHTHRLLKTGPALPHSLGYLWEPSRKGRVWVDVVYESIWREIPPALSQMNEVNSSRSAGSCLISHVLLPQLCTKWS